MNPARRRHAWGFAASLLLLLPVLLLAQDLELRLVGDEIRLRAPGLHFLQGRVLERVQNGAPVVIHLVLSIAVDNRANVFKRVSERFVVSYDLWEEKFSVTTARSGAQNTTHKSAPAAEAWSVDQLAVQSIEVPGGRNLWFKLEARAEGLSPETSENGQTSTVTLRQLIDMLSRTRPGNSDARWSVEKGPMKLQDLRRNPAEKKSARLITSSE